MIRKIAVGTALFLCSAALCFAAFEAVFLGYYWVRDGKYRSVRDMAAFEFNAYQEQFDPKTGFYKKLVETESLFPHPYLAYVRHSIPPKGIRTINRQGFFGHEFSETREPGVFKIMITGGSVATGYGAQTLDRNRLENELNAHYTNDRIKRFVVYNRAHGAWKQPQQLINVLLHAHEIDGLITLDGFNEAQRIWQDPNMQIELPSGNYRTGLLIQYGRTFETLALRLDSALRERLFTDPVVSRSKLAYFVVTRIRAKLQEMADRSQDLTDPRVHGFANRMFRLPDGWSVDQKRERNVQMYKRFLLYTNLIARANGVRCLHILQPTIYYGKELTQEEAGHRDRMPPDAFSMDLYQHIVDELMSLREAGVPVFDFLDVFQEARGQTLYNDHVHFSNAGFDIIQRRILVILEREWGLKRNDPDPANETLF